MDMSHRAAADFRDQLIISDVFAEILAANFDEFLHRLRTFSGIARQGLLDDLGHGGRQIRHQFLRTTICVGSFVLQQRQASRSGKRSDAGHQCVQHGAERVDVGTGVPLIRPAKLLRARYRAIFISVVGRSLWASNS